jgi:putative membrane protein
MKLISVVLIIIVAVLHTWFMVLEIFFWDQELGRGIFNTSESFAKESAALAMNQGLYNGFLVAGLVWGLIADRNEIKYFFLICVVVAGIFGALTVKPSIFFVQALPALLALISLRFAKQ